VAISAALPFEATQTGLSNFTAIGQKICGRVINN